MKKIFLSLFSVVALSASAQVSVSEPEFVNSYCVLTSDSTFDVLPKENGVITKHVSKSRSLLGKIGKVAPFAGALGSAGALAGAQAGSMSGLSAGINTMVTANSIGSVASSASALAGSVGMDIVFEGKESPFTVSANDATLRFLVKATDNSVDPLGLYRIVRFTGSKKDRRIQWMEIEPSLLGGEEAKNGGYISFVGHKYGTQSYILSVPSSELSKGEYGIFLMSCATASGVPMGTFSIK